jgi:hypothetical protein
MLERDSINLELSEMASTEGVAKLDFDSHSVGSGEWKEATLAIALLEVHHAVR